MKKSLLTILLCAAATVTYAQKIRVTSGSIDFLKGETLIGAVFTYDNMQVGKLTEEDYIARKTEEYNKKEPGRGDQWLVAWTADRQERYEPKFIELFNKHMSEKRDLAIGIDNGARYVFHINTYFTEPGFNVGIMRQNASITLSIKVVDSESGENVARILVENASANDFMGTDFDVAYRIQECYAKAGRELAKFFIKQLKF